MHAYVEHMYDAMISGRPAVNIAIVDDNNR
jgi:hypothetical protein